MIQATPSSFHIRRLRLATGLILLTYVTTHLLNHALGLISLDAMAEGRVWFVGFWRFPLCTVALYAALLTHFLLALWAMYRRRRLFAMSAPEALQLLLGLCVIPQLLKPSSRNSRPKRSTTKPKAIVASPVRIHARNVRSFAR